ncbi:MAG: zf-HC2 domain-containing protein [FCB group bacterium]|nr:zf-HC2 domain-containing protein [FCB group bacterium]
MNCTQAQEEFAALLDGELAPEERAEVERHLSQCSDCLRDLDGLKRVDTIYRQLPSISAPEGFEERVRQATRPKPVLRFPDLSRRRQMSWPLVAAAAFLLVAGAVVLQFGLPAKEQQMTVASLEKGVTASTPPPVARAIPEEAKLETAMDAAAPMASPPPAEVMTGVAVETPAAAPPPPPADEVLMVTPEARSAEGATKLKRAAREAPVSPGIEVEVAPPAAESAQTDEFFFKESAPAPVQTFGAAGAAQAESAPVEMAAPPAPAAAAPAPEMPKVMAEPPTAMADMAESDRLAEVGKRVFEQRDGIWYEAGYDDQKTTHLVRGSSELRKLIASHSDLGKVLELGERVVFKTDGKWYRVDPRAGR